MGFFSQNDGTQTIRKLLSTTADGTASELHSFRVWDAKTTTHRVLVPPSDAPNKHV